MTVANESARTSAVGTNVVGQEIAFSFPVLDSTEVVVKSRVTATGVEATLVEGTDYTVSVSGDLGGTVTMVAAWANTYQIWAIRDVARTQTLDLEHGGVFSAENLEAALDKGRRIDNDHADALARSIHIPVTDSAALDMEIPNSVDRALRYLFFDASGEPTAVDSVDASALSITAFWESVVASGNLSDTVTALGGAATVKAALNVDHVYDVRDYGAVIDGTTDDSDAIQDAATAAAVVNGAVFFPPGQYRITKTITFTSGVSVFGPGAEIVELLADVFSDPMFKWTNATEFTVSGLTFTGGQLQTAFAGAGGEDRAAILLDTCSSFTVRDIYVSAKSIGVALDTCTQGAITDSRFVGFCDPAHYGDGSGYNYAKGIYIGHDSGACSEITVSTCDFENWGDAVGFSAASSRCVVSACTVNGICDNGVYGSSGADNLVQGCYLRNCLGYGIKMRGAGHRAIGNRIYNCGSATLSLGGGGIRMTSSSLVALDVGCVVADNYIDTTTSNGIILCRATGSDVGMRGFIVTGNVCVNCLDNTVADNYGASCQIGIGVQQGVIAGNVFKSDGAASLRGSLALMGSAADHCADVTVANNVFIDVNKGGCFSQYSDRITFVNNSFYEVEDQALRLYIDCDSWYVSGNTGYNSAAAGTIFIYADSTEATNCQFIGNRISGTWTTATNSAADKGSGSTILFNDDADLPEIIDGTFLAQRTVIKSVDVDDDASTDDYQFDDDAANKTEQVITLTNILPAYALLTNWQIRCVETVTGSAAMQIDLGTTSGGNELGTGSPDTADDILSIAAAGSPALAPTDAARSLYFSGTPGVNWNTLDAGRWVVMLTYIDYGTVYSQTFL